jgi:hypothetical protein
MIILLDDDDELLLDDDDELLLDDDDELLLDEDEEELLDEGALLDEDDPLEGEELDDAGLLEDELIAWGEVGIWRKFQGGSEKGRKTPPIIGSFIIPGASRQLEIYWMSFCVHPSGVIFHWRNTLCFIK